MTEIILGFALVLKGACSEFADDPLLASRNLICIKHLGLAVDSTPAGWF